MDIFPRAKQRPALIEFARAVRARDHDFRRDECRDWRLNGKHGFVYAMPRGYQLFFGGTARSWTYAKRALSFARVIQDGDGEGFLFLDRAPTEEDAAIIRDKLGIRKKREPGEHELARLRAAAPTISPFGRQKSPSSPSMVGE
jgi:hypothetical protein